MSLILDALRKSEAERRRGEAPGLFTALPTPVARASRQASPWPWLVALAILAFAALAWWFWPTPPVEVVAIPVKPLPAPIASTPAPPVPEVVAPPPSSRRTPGPIEADQLGPDLRRGDELVQRLPLPSVPTAPPVDTPPPAVAEPPLEALPTLATLAPAERATLPPLKLSMHVWSEAPNARLAIIDGQRVMEGSTIGESIVAEIRRDGVVLEVHGRRYLLPRP